METTPTLNLLERFADAMETDGIAAVSAALLTDLVDAARSVDASPIALEVLLDPTEPSVVRERAYSKLASQIIGRASSLGTGVRSIVDTRPLLPA
jgi:hypothetical protein